MNFTKLPVGFAMALAQNEVALNAYSAMGDAEKQAVLEKAHNARSEKEMHEIVYTLANSPM